MARSISGPAEEAMMFAVRKCSGYVPACRIDGERRRPGGRVEILALVLNHPPWKGAPPMLPTLLNHSASNCH